MKRFILGFLHRGLVASGIGPIVLAIVYIILQKTTDLQSLSVGEVCVGIFSLTALAFIAGGMNSIYQIERLPLMAAILIHGAVLYCGYLCAYLLNDWLDLGAIPIITFTAIFIVGYIVIWAFIYSMIRRSTVKLNKTLKKKQENIRV